MLTLFIIMSIIGLIAGLKSYGKKKVAKDEEEYIGYEAGIFPEEVPEPIIKIVKKQPKKAITSNKK